MANKQRGMLASQLIDVLQQGIELYGDFSVFSEADWTYIGTVEYHKDLFSYFAYGKHTKGEGPHFVLLPYYSGGPVLEITDFYDPLHPEPKE